MKKMTLAFATLALTAGAAMAENPNMGVPADLYSQDTQITITQVQNPIKTDTLSGSELYSEELLPRGDR